MCCVMGDPELRSDENILIRTPGVYVKSIPFEGILTNKRIILVDKVSNLLPQKEIPLVTIKDIESGENAIRDQIIKLSVLTRAGETRQMILTFSRQAGGNRIKERDAWLKGLKENTSSTFDQVIRKVIPGLEQPAKRPKKSASPRIEVVSSPIVRNIPATEKTPGKKELEGLTPVKKIIETRPAPALPLSEKKGFETSSLQFGTYCSRCGNRVPDGSGYCNRCGSRIFVPGGVAAAAIPPAREAAPGTPTIEKSTRTIEQLIEPSSERITPWAAQPEPEALTEQEPVTSFTEAVSYAPDEKFTETGEKPDFSLTTPFDSRYSQSMPPPDKPPVHQRPWDRFSFKPGKKAVIGIIVVIIIIAVVLGGFFLYPIISQASGSTPGEGNSLTTLPTLMKNSGNAVFPTKSLKPTGKPTSPAAPGNSPANVGF
jgi:hypothetical protein